MKELSAYIGHSDIRRTFNRYGHLMPGGEAAAAAELDAVIDGPQLRSEAITRRASRSTCAAFLRDTVAACEAAAANPGRPRAVTLR